MKDHIVIAASLAQKPLQGGHAWVLLQYLLGFRKLGWKVLLIDSLADDMYCDASGQPCAMADSVNLQVFVEMMKRFGLEGDYCLLCHDGAQTIGVSRKQALERTGSAVLLLNIMGFLEDREIIERADRHVFLDIDPGFGQMWESLGLASMFDGYDDYVTIGESMGRSECMIPDCGRRWITTPQPVVLDHWPVHRSLGNDKMTSVISWRGAYDPVEWNGRIYGLRAHEFRKFARLPTLTDQAFELALSIHAADAADQDLLRANGWATVNPLHVAGDPWSYQSYIQASSAEIMVAKNIYVKARSGWFSDRSICYLASGKPVLAQDTGWRSMHSESDGVLWFSSLEEAVEGVARISADYPYHARAARELAETCFESDRVLSRLLRQLGII
jgi:hypothetical protein